MRVGTEENSAGDFLKRNHETFDYNAYQFNTRIPKILQLFQNQMVCCVILRPVIYVNLRKYHAPEILLKIIGKHPAQAVLAPTEMAVLMTLLGYGLHACGYFSIRLLSHNPMYRVPQSLYFAETGLPRSEKWRWYLTRARWYSFILVTSALQTTCLLMKVCERQDTISRVTCVVSDNAEFWWLGVPILTYPVARASQWLWPNLKKTWNYCISCCCWRSSENSITNETTPIIPAHS